MATVDIISIGNSHLPDVGTGPTRVCSYANSRMLLTWVFVQSRSLACSATTGAGVPRGRWMSDQDPVARTCRAPGDLGRVRGGPGCLYVGLWMSVREMEDTEFRSELA